jgi:hypothetical protein
LLTLATDKGIMTDDKVPVSVPVKVKVKVKVPVPVIVKVKVKVKKYVTISKYNHGQHKRPACHGESHETIR